MERATRLNKHFFNILSGKVTVTPSNGPLFLEALYGQPNPAETMVKLVGSEAGVDTLKTAIRYDLSPKFMNTHASAILQYLQSPDLKAINNGDFLDDILLHIVDPPIFWVEFRKAFLSHELDDSATTSFGWLLLRLCTLPLDKATKYREDKEMPTMLKDLLSSPIPNIKAFGAKIEEALSVSLPTRDANTTTGSGPGGRHDNDFADFRKIAILPTNGELESKEVPFMRPSSVLEDPETISTRVATHLDNQFRLLREDMMYEMREEMQVALGTKKGRHRGSKIKGFQVKELDFGTDRKATKWGLVLVCDEDFPEMKKLEKAKDRKEYLDKKRQFFKHQSLACLLVDKEIIAFPCIYRDEERLAKNPPEIVLQFEDAESTQNALRRLKMGDNVTLIQIDTATFAYEPILKGLQQAKTLPLSFELLLWKKGDQLEEISDPPSFVEALRADSQTNLKYILNTANDIKLDKSQARSLISGLTQKVSLIQGPPGTGKSFIGGLIAKAIHDLTTRTILVVCYTNHALDDILTSLLDIGIPEASMLRLGGKSTPRTEALTMQKQGRSGRNATEWNLIDGLKDQIKTLRRTVEASFNQYMSKASFSSILNYLEIEDPEYFEAFVVPEQDDGMEVAGKQGKAVQPDYLIERWSQGKGPGPAFGPSLETSTSKKVIWDLPSATREDHIRRWRDALLQEAIQDLSVNAKEYNRCYEKLNRAFSTDMANVLRGKRIVGCTTTAAAKYREEIQTFNPDVLLVEEAGEILESHVLTSLGPETSQMILIGDHKQLRPKVNHYLLTVENGEGYDLNRSLFERLILKDYPHESLSQQHRMRPEISALIRHLTYPELVDAPKTLNRPDLLGVRDNIVFIQHEHGEDENPALADRNDMASTSSKQNSYEAFMVLKIVKYLAQQGYGTDKLVILTPYLGQLQKLRELLKKDSDPVLNDLDNYELIKAGLVDPATIQRGKNQIRLATIDNYQGEESDVVIVSLTRSNVRCDIGFMFSPERLNVLLSRARNSLIMLGNVNTFKNARKGKDLWRTLFALLAQGKHLYQGLPVKCGRHPGTTAILSQPGDFDTHCPDGGCSLPCETLLSCNLHTCPSMCHQLADHSKVSCEEKMTSTCPNGHNQTWPCHKGSPKVCDKCERVKKLAKKKQQEELEARMRREAEQKAHLEKMDALNAQIESERRTQEEARLAAERANAILQKQNDLASAKASREAYVPSATPAGTSSSHASSSPQAASTNEPSSQNALKSTDGSIPGGGIPSGNSGGGNPSGNPSAGPDQSSSQNPSLLSKLTSAFKSFTAPKTSSQHMPTRKPFKDVVESPSQKEWKRQKSMEGAQNDAIDEIMDMIGLEAVKERVLGIKAKIDTNIRQNATLKHERFNVVLLGNPGTGKTTVARHYAKFLANVKAIPGATFEETTGARLAQNGVGEAEKLVEGVVKAGGGAIFVDEAYQLTSGNSPGGAAVLDFLLAEMENRVGTVVFILAGYNKEMEKFFEHNPGLKSRVPYQFHFADYKDEELMSMFESLLKKTYAGRMKVDGRANGLFGRIVIRRLGRRRGHPGFGNARDLQTVFSQIRERQAIRLTKERKEGINADDFFLTREDLIGTDPSKTIQGSKEWTTLQSMIGLKAVKDSVKSLFSLIEENFQRELLEQEVLDVSLNRVFLGSPGTGKTTVAKLYGKILADIGLLTNGEVVTKNPSDFVGAVLGASEAQTKAILANTVGKVLIIDEAYMLYGGGGNNGQGSGSNQFKTSVIDTIVAEVQSVPGEDRCVILVGYKEQMMDMFQHVNPGLSRRFKIEDAFNFEDFNDTELLEIFEMKLKQQDLDATDQAKKIAIERLGRLRNRPNFGNAGEVDNVITRAKTLAVARRARLPSTERSPVIVFEAEDIDPDWNRSAKAAADLVKLFSDIVGCEDIIKRLNNYQELVEICKVQDRDPREQIPTNFVFTGPPGTGKTTVARKIGQVFYNMGLLASGEVEECSASDLVGQYVGQTGPKTKKLFQKALGKVLFIDEAYRLSGGHFAQEAIDELVGLLTHPDYKGKLIVILAGYEKDMNQLMSVNSGLSSRFPDQVVFVNMDAERCLTVISKELQKKNIQTDGWDSDESSAVNIEMKELIRDMSELADWGNARDMITVSKEMVNQALISSSKSANPSMAPILSGDDALNVMKKILSDRQRRSKIPSKPRRPAPDLPQQTSTPEPPPAPSLGTATTTNTQPASSGTGGSGQARGRNAPPPRNRGGQQGDRGGRGGRGGSGSHPQPPPTPDTPRHHDRGGARRGGRGNSGQFSPQQSGQQQLFPNPPPALSLPADTNTQSISSVPTNRAHVPHSPYTGRNDNRGGHGRSNSAINQDGNNSSRGPRQSNNQQGLSQRDPGVSDALWRQMAAAKRAAAEIERDARNRIKEMERKAEEERKEEERQKKIAADLQRAEAAAREASERAELQRQREEARLKALAAKAAKERAAAELRARQEAERQRQAQVARTQQRLREMGVCPAGYEWINMGSVYRCAGGAHTVSAGNLGF